LDQESKGPQDIVHGHDASGSGKINAVSGEQPTQEPPAAKGQGYAQQREWTIKVLHFGSEFFVRKK